MRPAVVPPAAVAADRLYIRLQELAHRGCVQERIERVPRQIAILAVDRLALRQAPLSRRDKKTTETPDPEAAARIAATLPEVTDEELRQALARLGAALKVRR